MDRSIKLSNGYISLDDPSKRFNNIKELEAAILEAKPDETWMLCMISFHAFTRDAS